MRHGRICAVEYLQTTDDSSRIAEAQELFKDRGPAIGADGFEVWDGPRFIYRFVQDGAAQPDAAADAKCPPTWFQLLMRKAKFEFSRITAVPNVLIGAA